MNELEARYLKENHFSSYKNEYTSTVILNYVWANELENVNGFCDEKQIGFIKVQFGDLLKKISGMGITVRHITLNEYEVKLSWHADGQDEWQESSISGEGIYELVSQAIVLADVYNF